MLLPCGIVTTTRPPYGVRIIFCFGCCCCLMNIFSSRFVNMLKTITRLQTCAKCHKNKVSKKNFAPLPINLCNDFNKILGIFIQVTPSTSLYVQKCIIKVDMCLKAKVCELHVVPRSVFIQSEQNSNPCLECEKYEQRF